MIIGGEITNKYILKVKRSEIAHGFRSFVQK